MENANKNLRIFLAIILSGIGVMLSYAINFVLTPFITKQLGIEAFGFVTLAKTLIGYAGILTIALTSFIIRYISIDFHKSQFKEANEYYSSSIGACLTLSLFILISGVFLVLVLEKLIKIPTTLISSVKLLFIIVLVNFCITTVTTPFTTATYIKNRLDLSGCIKILSYALEAIIMYILFSKFEARVWYVGMGSLGACVVTFITNYFLTHKLTPELKFNRSYISFSKIKNLLSNGIWNSINQLGNVLNSGLDLLISNLLLTDVGTGQISVAKTISTMFVSLLQIVSQPFQPLLIKAYASEDKEYFLYELKKSMNICGYFGNIAFAGFFALGNLYYKLWLPGQDNELLHILTLITVFNYITDSLMRPIYYVNTLTLKNKIPCIVTIFGGFLNVVSMYILLKYTHLGVYAVVITTAVIMVSINLFFNPIYASKCLGIRYRYFYPVILRHILSCAILCIVLKVINYVINPHNWSGLILTAIIMAIVGFVFHISITMGVRYLYTLIQKFIMKISKKNK